MTRTFAFVSLLAAAVLPVATHALVSLQAPIKVLLITGQSNQYHNWPVSSALIRRQLEGSGRFLVTVATTPPKGREPNQDMSSFAPDFRSYGAVVLDYEGFEFAAATKQQFVEYVRNGGGLVVIHAADNAFPAWPEYNDMIGVGGWGGFTPGYVNRTVAAGAKVRWRGGKTVLDRETPGVAQHPSPHSFLITVRAADHPVVQGLPSEWLHARDELYSNLRGPAGHLTVLATATAPTTMRDGTGENEPMIMALAYGKGRVFHDTLGHVGPTEDESVASMNSVDFITLLQRGTEWAATGRVTIPVPPDFPSRTSASVRR